MRIKNESSPSKETRNALALASASDDTIEALAYVRVMHRSRAAVRS